MSPFKRLMPGSVWDTRDGADTITSEGIARKLKFGPESKLAWYVTGTPDGAPSASGSLRISQDIGESWSTVSLPAGCDGCLDLAEDPSGDLWGLFFDSSVPGGGNGYTAEVDFSNDGGTTWSQKYVHTAGMQAFNIAVSPRRTTQVKIAFVAMDTNGLSTGTKYQLVISVDTGVTWNVKDIIVV